MGLPATKHKMTLEEFLAWEAGQPERWEFFDGEAFMMAGGSDVHNVVTGNMYMALRIGLQNTRCNVFMSDVRLRLAASDAHMEDVTYWREAQLDPAATVAASEREQQEADAEAGDADAPRKRRRRRRNGSSASSAPTESA